MSARPGSITDVVEIDLPRPRWQSHPEYSPEFLHLERRLHDLLEHDVDPDRGVEVPVPRSV